MIDTHSHINSNCKNRVQMKYLERKFSKSDEHTNKSIDEKKQAQGLLYGDRKISKLLQAHLGRTRMALQAFSISQHGRSLTENLRPGFTHFDDAGALLEVVHTQGR